jgi:U3 small nucleolar RNA-associated protein 25
MQNWDHLTHVLENLNLVPKESPRGCDFSRLKPWHLDGTARHLRQSLLFAHFGTPETNALFQKAFCNVRGKVKIGTAVYTGSVSRVAVTVPQVRPKSPSPPSLVLQLKKTVCGIHDVAFYSIHLLFVAGRRRG